MPWELGLGDGIFVAENAITLPVVNDYQPRVAQGYLNMYGYVKTAKSSTQTFEDWAIRYPDGSAKWFRDWLKS